MIKSNRYFNVDKVIKEAFVLQVNRPSKRTLFSTIPNQKRTCWKCGYTSNQKENLFFCSRCGIVQEPLNGVSFFELFGLGNSFDVDLIKLATTFKETQKLLHPDKFSLKSKVCPFEIFISFGIISFFQSLMLT